MSRSFVILAAILATMASGVGAQTTNWSPKPPPRAYTARVQMHYVPLRETVREREELHAYDLPTLGSDNAGYRARSSALYEPPPDVPRPVPGRQARRESERAKEAGLLPEERTGVRALLAGDDLKEARVSPWDGLDGREMSRRMAEREWRMSHPGEEPGPELGRRSDPDSGAEDDAREDDLSFAARREDGVRERNPGLPAMAAAAFGAPEDRFGRIARDFVNGGGVGSIDMDALRPADFDEVARRFEELQKKDSGPAAVAQDAMATAPAAAWHNEFGGFSGASAWGDPVARGLRDGAFQSQAGGSVFQLSTGSGGWLGTPVQAAPDFRPALGGAWASPLDAQRPQPASGGPEAFKKPATLPW